MTDETIIYECDGKEFASHSEMLGYCKNNTPKIKAGDTILFDTHYKDGNFRKRYEIVVLQVTDSRWYGSPSKDFPYWNSYETLFQISKKPSFKIIPGTGTPN
jgi:hypothetical protein